MKYSKAVTPETLSPHDPECIVQQRPPLSPWSILDEYASRYAPQCFDSPGKIGCMRDSSTLVNSGSLLIVFGGLPGTGKTSIARDLAASMDAVYLRIDTIEQAIRNSPGVSQAIHEEGYRVAYAVAGDNLRLGRTVISDSVNPIQESRDAWMEVGRLTNSVFIEVEVVCSDAESHRKRVEQREAGIPGLKLPTWEEVLAREYQPWNRDHIVIDTAHKAVPNCVEELRAAMMSCLDRPYQR